MTIITDKGRCLDKDWISALQDLHSHHDTIVEVNGLQPLQMVYNFICLRKSCLINV